MRILKYKVKLFGILTLAFALILFLKVPAQAQGLDYFFSPFGLKNDPFGLGIDLGLGNDFSDTYLYSYHGVPISSSSNLSTEAKNVVSNASSSVVYINAYKDMPVYSWQFKQDGSQIYATLTKSGSSNQEVSSGSGFFITADGYILTNKHVVEDTAATYKVNYDGKNDVAAQVVYRDPKQDLAIVKIDGSNYPVLPLGDSSKLTVGQDIVAIGNALGRLTDYATQGSITSLSEDVLINDQGSSNETLSGVVESSAQLLPGDSGGPLLDLNGKVIGVNTATAIGGRRFIAGFSIPINSAKEIISKAGISL